MRVLCCSPDGSGLFQVPRKTSSGRSSAMTAGTTTCCTTAVARWVSARWGWGWWDGGSWHFDIWTERGTFSHLSPNPGGNQVIPAAHGRSLNAPAVAVSLFPSAQAPSAGCAGAGLCQSRATVGQFKISEVG